MSLVDQLSTIKSIEQCLEIRAKTILAEGNGECVELLRDPQSRTIMEDYQQETQHQWEKLLAAEAAVTTAQKSYEQHQKMATAWRDQYIAKQVVLNVVHLPCSYTGWRLCARITLSQVQQEALKLKQKSLQIQSESLQTALTKAQLQEVGRQFATVGYAPNQATPGYGWSYIRNEESLQKEAKAAQQKEQQEVKLTELARQETIKAVEALEMLKAGLQWGDELFAKLQTAEAAVTTAQKLYEQHEAMAESLDYQRDTKQVEWNLCNDQSQRDSLSRTIESLRQQGNREWVLVADAKQESIRAKQAHEAVKADLQKQWQQQWEHSQSLLKQFTEQAAIVEEHYSSIIVEDPSPPLPPVEADAAKQNEEPEEQLTELVQPEIMVVEVAIEHDVLQTETVSAGQEAVGETQSAELPRQETIPTMIKQDAMEPDLQPEKEAMEAIHQLGENNRHLGQTFAEPADSGAQVYSEWLSAGLAWLKAFDAEFSYFLEYYSTPSHVALAHGMQPPSFKSLKVLHEWVYSYNATAADPMLAYEFPEEQKQSTQEPAPLQQEQQPLASPQQGSDACSLGGKDWREVETPIDEPEFLPVFD